MNKTNGKTNNTGYRGKYYDPNYKQNKAKYGDLYDPKDFAIPNPNYQPRQRKSSSNYKGSAHRYHPNYNTPEWKRKQRRKNKAFFALSLIFALSTYLYITNATATGNDPLNLGITNSISTTGTSTTSITPNIDQLMTNTEIYVDSCDITGRRQPNVKVNVGYSFREYYGYTNEYSQLVYVQADQLTEQYKSEENSNNRYCNSQASVEGASGSYNRGHAIGDALGGDSNAYNIFPQLSNVNGGNYNNIEISLQNALYDGGSVTNFELKLTYPNSSTNIPSSYTMSYDLNGQHKEHVFDN